MSIMSQDFNVVNEQSGVVQEYGYDTKEENLHILYYIARNQLYSDEVMALLREYSVNAFDIHIATGQADRPIQVTLPTIFDPFLKIRDFGTGLDDKGIQEYVSFGASSKRSDPLQTGQLGVGCKCGFTYGDSFIVNSYQKNKLTSWSAYIDPSNKGKIAKLVTDNTEEPNGVEIIIPVKTSDVSKFHEKAMWFFSFSRVTPIFINASEEDIAYIKELKFATPEFSGKDWKYMGKGASYVVMGNIPYSINADVFSESELRYEIRDLLGGGIIINMPLGAVDFAASREQLKYTPSTKACLSASLNVVADDLAAQCSVYFDNCKTLWEAKILYRKVFDYSSRLYRLRKLFKKKINFKGYDLSGENFPAIITDEGPEVSCSVYSVDSHYRSGKKVQHTEVRQIIPANNHLVVINDTGITHGIVNRIIGQIATPSGESIPPEYEKVYVMTFKSDVFRDQWLAETGIDCIMPSLASLTKEPMSKFFPKSGLTNGVKNNKHISKEFSYDMTSSKNHRYRGPRSNFWNIAEVDLENDNGVYLVIEKFSYEQENRITIHPREFKDIIDRLIAAGIKTPAIIYGLKAESVTKAQKNPKMINFWTWMKAAVIEYLATNPNLAQQVANSYYIDNTIRYKNSRLPDSIKKIMQWLYIATAPETHPIKVLGKKIQELTTYNVETVNRLALITHLANCSPAHTVMLPTHNIEEDISTVFAKYPLLGKVIFNLNEYCLEADNWGKSLSEYIEMVDCKKS